MSNKAVVVIPMPSRFERARLEAATRATMSVAANTLETVEKRVGRAHALMEPAIGFDAPRRRLAVEQAKQSIREAIAELQEVLQEIER